MTLRLLALVVVFTSWSVAPAAWGEDQRKPAAQPKEQDPRPWWEEYRSTDQLLKLVKGWSDQELQTNFEECPAYYPVWDGWGGNAHDACLNEMVRRGGKVWEEYLQGVLAERRATWEELDERRATGEEEHWFDRADLEVLTALRRLAGKRDPMTIRIENEGSLDTVFPELPVFFVRLQNVDDEGDSFYLTAGGDYRTGRLARWRMEVQDEEGKRIGVLADWPGGLGGGACSRGLLRPGGALGGSVFSDGPKGIPLPLLSYAQIHGPGRYTVEIQYHDQTPIAHMGDARSLVLSRSDKASFTWKPREVRVSPEEQAAIRRLLSDLYEQKPVVLCPIHYHEDMEFRGKPRSTVKAIYRHGWKALPVLMDELARDEDLTHRAWLLAMLSNLTGLNEATSRDAAFGRYRRTGGPIPTGGVAGAYEGGRPTESGQARLVAAWSRFRDMVRVVE